MSISYKQQTLRPLQVIPHRMIKLTTGALDDHVRVLVEPNGIEPLTS